jgi:hypothetical protein
VRALASLLRCPLMQVFRNPHHLSGVVFAMLQVNAATLIWASIVLAKQDTLRNSGSRYAFVTDYIHENLLAALVGTIALVNLGCLVRHEKPTWLRNFGYGVLCLCWTFVFAWNLIGDGPIYATATALSGPMAFAALYAFLDGHLDGSDGDGDK